MSLVLIEDGDRLEGSQQVGRHIKDQVNFKGGRMYIVAVVVDWRDHNEWVDTSKTRRIKG